ncbi:DEAD/DEAH box helicase [Metabacillus sp. KIGAM252]|uniref:DEAD/DEAH box helicase n=1 Tax=Metabacillus flavus TaxID=2823519 RepID=A0ABS5LJZ7_9BACI|nr:DEAD/DEAH box helicase [Metabacillus flavus]MBS2971038.1 DEAD/DEAH box helicase [Metabacillus flavus]
MNIELNKKIIEKLCGRVSLKSGDSLRRSNKVKFQEYREDGCHAIVQSTEDFRVSVTVDPDGTFHADCSCPKLISFKQECQHIAAVLLTIDEHQTNGTIPEVKSDVEVTSVPDYALTEELLTAFKDRQHRKTGEQNYFENRTVLNAVFTCKPVQREDGELLLALELTVESVKVWKVNAFLENIISGEPFQLSSHFVFDPLSHCFTKESDAVIQQLFKIVQNETAENESHQLLLSPFSWNLLLPSLMRAPFAELEINGEIYSGLRLSEGILPLQFDFYEEGRGYELKAGGLQDLIFLKPYQAVLSSGVLFQLGTEDFERLAELKRVIDASGKNTIPIPPQQVNLYLEKVVPGLRKLGEVAISETISKRMAEASLTAKLYLDRVKNRLLAGLEFHYGKIVFNPLDEQEVRALSRVIRDEEKEDLILKLMEESSFARTDSGYYLQNELLEYEFLYHVLPKLEKFAQVHATTAVRSRIFKETAGPRIKVEAKRERTNWLEFKFEMDGIPEKEIRDVLAALDEKRKYYRLRSGALLSLETREYEEIYRFLTAMPVQAEDWEKELEVPLIKGLQLLDSIKVSDTLTLEDSVQQLLNGLLHPDELEFAVPKKLEPVLRDYQKNGYRWMKSLAKNGFGGILADDMGLGKTLQSIAYMVSVLPEIRRLIRPVLIVCPSSLLYNWKNEIDTFAPEIDAIIMDGSRTERASRFRDDASADVLITSYPLVRQDIQVYEKRLFHTVFFDEAQAFKNPVTQTARAVKRVQAKHRFALTGTPVENSREELWSIFHVVFPELFMGLKEYSTLTRKKVARRIRPFMLRRMKEDVLSELPEKIESMEIVELLPEQKKLYAAYLAKLRHDTLKHLDKETIQKNRIKILAGITRLRQICCHPSLFVDGYSGGSAKFDQLMNILEEARLSGRRVLIFSQFTSMLDLIGRALAVQGMPYFYLDGQTALAERVELCTRFNTGERNLFLISLKAGGTGLNLTGADTVIHFDTWWNPAVEEQAADRAHRMGQTNTVNVIKLVTRGTIEEKMNELQDKKRQLIKEIVDLDEKMPFTLTEEDIRDLLRV